MQHFVRIKEFLLHYDLSKYYEIIKGFIILALGVWPSILDFLNKYSLDKEHLILGIAGQGAIILYKTAKNKSRGKKSPVDLLILVIHLCLGGFFSLILTSGVMQMFKVVDSYKILWIAIGIGGFYEIIVSSIVDLANEGAKIFKERAKKSIKVFFNLDKEE